MISQFDELTPLHFYLYSCTYLCENINQCVHFHESFDNANNWYKATATSLVFPNNEYFITLQ